MNPAAIQIRVPCLRLDHRKRLPRTARTSSGSTPASTLITARPGSSIWIDPDRRCRESHPRQRHVRLCRHGHRHQPALRLLANTQGSLAILVSPLEHLVRIYSMLTGHSGNRSSLGQTWPLRCDASPPVFFATASGKGPLPQLQPYRSQGNRGTEKTSCLYGQKRTLTFPLTLQSSDATRGKRANYDPSPRKASLPWHCRK